jgi:hypothetical protein
MRRAFRGNEPSGRVSSSIPVSSRDMRESRLTRRPRRVSIGRTGSDGRPEFSVMTTATLISSPLAVPFPAGCANCACLNFGVQSRALEPQASPEYSGGAIGPVNPIVPDWRLAPGRPDSRLSLKTITMVLVVSRVAAAESIGPSTNCSRRDPQSLSRASD